MGKLLATEGLTRAIPATTVRKTLSIKLTLQSMFVRAIEPKNHAGTSKIALMKKDAVIIIENTLRVAKFATNVETTIKLCMS